MSKRLLQDIEQYYDEKILTYGATPMGVDWNSEDSQEIRFAQLVKVIRTEGFSVADLGCGYGALFNYLSKVKNDFSYEGYDLSSQMISSAKQHVGNTSSANFKLGNKLDQETDYSIASGIFNVRQNTIECEWHEYITETLENMNNFSKCGFSFNCLTKYSDNPRMKSYLYYADPLQLFDYCKKRFSRNVALLHDYDLFEFTIIVRKLYD